MSAFTARKHNDPFVSALADRTPDTDTPAVDLSKLPAYVGGIVAVRLGVKPEGSVTDHAEPVDYSDGYGGTYAVGE